MTSRTIACLLCCLVLGAAEEAELISEHLPTAPQLVVPRAATAPGVDADPADVAWDTAAVVDGLSAANGTARPTEVRLLWDPDALYVRFIATDTSIHLPFGTERDAKHYQGDVAELFLDPVGDARQYYEVQVSPGGGVFDLCMVLTAPPLAAPDGVLDGAMRSRDWWSFAGYDLPGLRHAQRTLRDAAGDSTGWIVDLAIPAKVVMKRRGGGAIGPGPMRANLARYDWDQGVSDPKGLTPMYWAPVRHGCPHLSPLAMGLLELQP